MTAQHSTEARSAASRAPRERGSRGNSSRTKSGASYIDAHPMNTSACTPPSTTLPRGREATEAHQSGTAETAACMPHPPPPQSTLRPSKKRTTRRGIRKKLQHSRLETHKRKSAHDRISSTPVTLTNTTQEETVNAGLQARLEENTKTTQALLAPNRHARGSRKSHTPIQEEERKREQRTRWEARAGRDGAGRRGERGG